MKQVKLKTAKVIPAIFMLVIMVVITACSGSAEREEDKSINLIYANWSEGVAMTHLAAEILETELGYEVATKMTDIESVFEELNAGDYDVFVDAWLPQTHGMYMSQYENNLEDLGINVQQVRTGLMVPDYMEIESISDINEGTDQIIGIDSGAGIMTATRQALETYELDTELVEGSEGAMTEALDEAIKRREPIIVTGWTPHWIYNRYDLKFLDDPQNVYGESEKIHTVSRMNFTSDHPRASLFFERFELSDSQLGALMDEIRTFPDNERHAVKNWIDNNEFVVNRWVRGLQPEREKVM